jgi:protein-disulfide isomerase
VNKILANLGAAIPVACAVVVTALVVRRELFAPPPATAAMSVESRTVPDWRSYAEGQRIGPADAKVTIVEFSDFECPFCRATAARLKAVRARYPRDVALVYRYYPLPYHTHAVAAARASLCAARQGRFEAFHDALFARQDSLGVVAWSRLADDAAVPDRAGFDRCMGDPGAPPEIERDLRAGTRLGVRGTPTLLVNDRLLDGAPPGTLEEAVERALRGGE